MWERVSFLQDNKKVQNITLFFQTLINVLRYFPTFWCKNVSIYIFFGWIENKIIGEITHNDTFYEHWDQQKITTM